MKVVGLISGGKDSCYNLVQCVAAGHEIVALANLKPADATVQEIDSQMYQTVGTSAVEYIAKAMELPLYVDTISGSGTSVDMDYFPTEGDEVEDLTRLLTRVKNETGAEAVSVGAILSDYQRVRVESVCLRLSLVPLAYLWRRGQAELLREMIDNGLKSILIKVACLGLCSRHLGLTLAEMEDELINLNKKYGVNVCGEGGEYETFTLDSPLFRQELEIVEMTCVNHSHDAFAPVSYLHLVEVKLKPKVMPPHLSQQDLLKLHNVSDLSPSAYIAPFQVSTTSECGAASLPPLKVCQVKSVVPDTGKSDAEAGWISIANIPGCADKPQVATLSAFNVCRSELSKLGTDLSCLAKVTLFIRDMADYAEINKEYSTVFGLNPPVRVCVAVGEENLPPGCLLSMSVVGWTGDGSRRCLHVQSVSHWAPSNIGPYSQGVLVGQRLFVSGQIGLVPGSMTLLCEKENEPELSYRHVEKVRQVLAASATTAAPLAVCYVLDRNGASLAQSYWSANNSSQCSTLEIVIVKQLPKNANFEWEFVANLESERE